VAHRQNGARSWFDPDTSILIAISFQEAIMFTYPALRMDIPRFVGVLQHWQVLLAPRGDVATVTTITLADVQRVTITLQHEFGATASLEAIIQTLVAEHLREQVEQRRSSQAAQIAVAS
jgi:hypothetical protein